LFSYFSPSLFPHEDSWGFRAQRAWLVHRSFFSFIVFLSSLVSYGLCIAFAVMAFTTGYGDFLFFLEYLLHVRMACGKRFQKQIERKGTGPVFGMAGMDTSAFFLLLYP